MMPLYKSLAQETKDTLIKDRSSCNAGLWYDKFCNTWRGVTDEYSWNLKSYKKGNENINPKQDWLKTVTGHAVGGGGLLREACTRQRLLAEAGGMKECVQIFSTVWRFVTGLGRQHPVENGFAWHHTLGVPYLPGSSVKGMVRAWVEQWEEDKEEATAVFGPKNGDVAVGSVIFFDALPTRRVLLEEDVMTPHYGSYYQDRENNPPGDWYDPTPIFFLTVADNQPFQFAVAPRSPHDPQSIQDAQKVMEWLESALTHIGAGAKTTVGYGIFKLDDKEKRKADAKYLKAQEQDLSKEERWRRELSRMEPGQLVNQFSRNWSRTQQNCGDDLEKYLEIIREIHGKEIQLWKNSEKKNENKAYRKIYPGA